MHGRRNLERFGPLKLAKSLIALPFLLGLFSGLAAAGTFMVDGSTPSCSDTGPGSSAVPYCTISAAIAAHNGPGTTIQVQPGIYREQITVPSSGFDGNPFVIQ